MTDPPDEDVDAADKPAYDAAASPDADPERADDGDGDGDARRE